MLLQLRQVAPEIYTAMAIKTDKKFSKTVAGVKKLAALNSAVNKTAGGREPAAQVLTEHPSECLPLKAQRFSVQQLSILEENVVSSIKNRVKEAVERGLPKGCATRLYDGLWGLKNYFRLELQGDPPI